MQVTVKVSSNKLRQATSSERPRGAANGGSSNPRRRGNVKSYVVESDSDEDDEEEEEEGEDEIQVGARAGLVGDDDDDDDDEMDEDEDAEGDLEEMDIDAEGDEEDAEGDIEMDIPPPPPAITISKPAKSAPAAKVKTSPLRASGRGVAVPVKHTAPRLLDDDDDDDELSELESEPEDVDMGLGDEDAEGDEEEIEDVDAEGDEIEVADEDAEGEDEEELDSEDGSRAGTPDLSKLTARQRARLGDASHEYLKLSDGTLSPLIGLLQKIANWITEVQAKKVFTAEELSMRRLEMARRRRNLSEKRNEEVKACPPPYKYRLRTYANSSHPDGNHQQAPQEAGSQDEPPPRPRRLRHARRRVEPRRPLVCPLGQHQGRQPHRRAGRHGYWPGGTRVFGRGRSAEGEDGGGGFLGGSARGEPGGGGVRRVLVCFFSWFER